jgi:hypothetical protein
MDRALAGADLERFRPLLPVGYEATAAAYRKAAGEINVADLSGHYSDGLTFFHERLVPHVKAVLHRLSGGEWDLRDYCAYGTGSDVDFMGHLLEATFPLREVAVYPGDWFGFKAGASQPDKVRFTASSRGALACMCIPSVRNGHFTEPMLEFLDAAEHCLLNLNLYPTLEPAERRLVAERLAPVLPKSLISISFSRGFALTASQLGVVLVHREHPMRRQFETQWNWYTYFFNYIAARAFLLLDLAEIERVDQQRREWVATWLRDRGMPVVDSGSYYVKSFQVTGDIRSEWSPLVRDGLLRLCFKPPMV